MSSKSSRDDFTQSTKDILAKRASYKCSICKCITVGPSFESISSVNNIGVAAHITAASPRGPRYNEKMTSKERKSISNGIWLCQTHAKLIDGDIATWSVKELHRIKTAHERSVLKELTSFQIENPTVISSNEGGLVPVNYGFMPVKYLVPRYKRFIEPILIDRKLSDESILGVFMCKDSTKDLEGRAKGTPWTLFVSEKWMNWMITGKNEGYPMVGNVPIGQIHGMIPAWPNMFSLFLETMVETNSEYELSLIHISEPTRPY